MAQNLEHEVNNLKIQLFHMEKKYEKEIENLNKQLQAYPPFRYFLNEGKNLPCSIPATKATHSTIPTTSPPPSANRLSHCQPY